MRRLAFRRALVSDNNSTLAGFWTLDPIDGTKGFLRGEQYAVCLALVVDSRVELGVLGCPNLPVSAASPDGPRGCIFVAARGEGAWQLPLASSSPEQPIKLMITFSELGIVR